MRDRLIELLKNILPVYICEQDGLVEHIADYLLDNSVIALPCKIGDEINGEIVHKIDYLEWGNSSNILKEGWVHTMDAEDKDSRIFCSHPINWGKLDFEPPSKNAASKNAECPEDYYFDVGM